MYPAIMRLMTPDPLTEKYYSMSPYVYCLNSPIRFIDLKRDSVSIAQVQIYDNVNQTNYAQAITTDLESQTGLTLTVSTTGQMTYVKDANGQPVIAIMTGANGKVVQVGGGLQDTPGNPGPVVTQMNIIRSELNALGGNYGQRMDYAGTNIGLYNYIPFDKLSQNLVNVGVVPILTNKYVRFK